MTARPSSLHFRRFQRLNWESDDMIYTISRAASAIACLDHQSWRAPHINLRKNRVAENRRAQIDLPQINIGEIRLG
jgi:hypothetical protein